LTCANLIERGWICETCQGKSLPLFAYGNYADPLKEIIINYKFRGITSLAGLFARLLAELFGEQIMATGAGLLIPIPLYSAREYYRGYNQAELLARELGCALGLEVDSSRLVRIRRRKPQAKLREAERAKNIKGVFKAVESSDEERVLIVDDVVTSGATVREATTVLRKAGYKVLGAIAIAHGR